jgi:hypothetical protein
LISDRGYHLATRGKLSLESHSALVDGQLSKAIKSLLPTPQFVATAQLVADQFVHSTLGELPYYILSIRLTSLRIWI